MKFMDYYRALVMQSESSSGGSGGGSDCPFLPPASEGYTEYKDALQKEYVYNLISQAGAYVGTGDEGYEQGISFELANAIADAINVNDKILFTGDVGEHRDYNPDTGDEIVSPAGVYALWGKLTFKEEPYEEEPREYTYVTMTVDGVVLRPFYADGKYVQITGNGSHNVYGANRVIANVPGDPYALAPADSAYVVTTGNSISYANLKNYWTNKNTTVKYRVRKNASVVVGGKVAIKYSNTWCMWGVVGSVTSVNTSYDDITLSEYHGFAYQNSNRSGETHVTANGTYSNTKNMQLDVNVAGGASGSINITANGTYDVTDKASAVVNVPSSGGGESIIDGSLTSYSSNTLTYVRPYAFAWCSNIQTIDLGAVQTISKISSFAWSGLTSLILRTNAVVQWETETGVSVTAFNSTPIADGNGYIYVPSALVDTYKATTNWSKYASKFRALENYTVDGTTTGALDPTKI